MGFLVSFLRKLNRRRDTGAINSVVPEVAYFLEKALKTITATPVLHAAPSIYTSDAALMLITSIAASSGITLTEGRNGFAYGIFALIICNHISFHVQADFNIVARMTLSKANMENDIGLIISIYNRMVEFGNPNIADVENPLAAWFNEPTPASFADLCGAFRTFCEYANGNP